MKKIVLSLEKNNWVYCVFLKDTLFRFQCAIRLLGLTSKDFLAQPKKFWFNGSISSGDSEGKDFKVENLRIIPLRIATIFRINDIKSIKN